MILLLSLMVQVKALNWDPVMVTSKTTLEQEFLQRECSPWKDFLKEFKEKNPSINATSLKVGERILVPNCQKEIKLDNDVIQVD